MPIASASKWLFGAYVVEKLQGVLSTSDGVLAPNDPSALPEGFRAQGTPLYCGQAIRRAWISGSVNNLNVR
ncbi:MAG: hypothetical protein JSR59_02970 [Proteobacteria bacterium]|nr:hypothetical protein [Pseudomonadota bacterium]